MKVFALVFATSVASYGLMPTVLSMASRFIKDVLYLARAM
jgi:hypothetical protein